MAIMTLLEIVQDILSDMEDDEVNSISDTSSSESVARIVRTCYYELVDELSLPGNDRLMELEAVSDPNRPNYLKLPDDYIKLHWFKYNGQDVKYLSPWEFLRFIEKRDTGANVVDFGGVTLKIDDTSQPTYWTSFDDKYLVLDSFNKNEESTLQASKTQALVQLEFDFRLADDTVPDLPSRLFPTLLSKSKARAFVAFKQVSNVKEDQAERRGLVRHQNDRVRTNGPQPMDRLPNYAKQGRTSRRRTPQRA